MMQASWPIKLQESKLRENFFFNYKYNIINLYFILSSSTQQIFILILKHKVKKKEISDKMIYVKTYTNKKVTKVIIKKCMVTDL